MFALAINSISSAVSFKDSVLKDSSTLIKSIFADNLLKPNGHLELAYNTNHHFRVAGNYSFFSICVNRSN